ncbi:MAG: type III-A CRISPR-associated protein Csm2 [Geminicoccaceae bacterium]
MRNQPPRPGQGQPPRPYGGSPQGRPTSPTPSGPSLEERLRSSETVVYFAGDDRKAMRAEMLDGTAEAVARKLRGVPASQLRRFFGSVMTLRRKIETEEPPAEVLQAEMAMLKASAAYTCKRLKYDDPRERIEGEPLELLSLFVRNARSVRDGRDFDAFARHFEAVIAYHKCFEVKKQSRE